MAFSFSVVVMQHAALATSIRAGCMKMIIVEVPRRSEAALAFFRMALRYLFI